jgi:hypothetical protein
LPVVVALEISFLVVVVLEDIEQVLRASLPEHLML